MQMSKRRKLQAHPSTASSASWGLSGIEQALEGLQSDYGVKLEKDEPLSPCLLESVSEGASRSLAEAVKAASAESSSEMPSKRGGQKKAVMKVKELMGDSKQKPEVTHPSLGRLWVTQASSQGYVQHCVEKKKVMLVGCTKQMASSSSVEVDHNAIVQTLAEVAAEHGLDKANIVSYRDEWRKSGKPPF